VPEAAPKVDQTLREASAGPYFRTVAGMLNRLKFRWLAAQISAETLITLVSSWAMSLW